MKVNTNKNNNKKSKSGNVTPIVTHFDSANISSNNSDSDSTAMEICETFDNDNSSCEDNSASDSSESSAFTPGGHASSQSSTSDHPPTSFRIRRKAQEIGTANSDSTILQLEIMIDEAKAKLIKLATAKYGSPEYHASIELTAELNQRKLMLAALQQEVPQESQQQASSDHHRGKDHLFVPPQLPFIFQWQTFMVDKTKPRHSTLADCFRHFESIVKMHSLDIEEHGRRLLPPCLSTNLQTFLDDFINNTTGGKPTWSAIKAAITSKFSAAEQDNRDSAEQKLMNMVMPEHKKLENHITHFNKLAYVAQCKDKRSVCLWFIKSLPAELFKQVSLQLQGKKKDNLDFVVNTTRSINATLEEARSKGRATNRAPYQGNSNRAKKGNHQGKELHCENHPQATSHATRDCFLNNSNGNNRGTIKGKKCNRCKRPVHSGKCQVKKPFNKGKNKHTLVPTKTAAEEREDDSEEMDTSDSESDKELNAMSREPMLC